MTLLDRISLVWRYGKGIFLVGALYNAVCALLLAGGFFYSFFVDTFILKVPVTAITVYLVMLFRDRDHIFFYINMGLSRRKLLTTVILIDFLALAVLETVILFIYG